MEVTIDLPEIEDYEVLTTGFSYALDGEFITIVLPLRKKRWRAEHGGDYLIIDSDGALENIKENYTSFDIDHYEFGNYFKTEEEAQAMADKIKKLLKEE